MGYEIDFLPVGDGESSGDAIALRFGDLYGSRDDQTVVVIDGGFKSSGEALVEHIRNYYGTDVVDLVISTHPDQDHSSGLSVVLENMIVGNLLMHRPWLKSDTVYRGLTDRTNYSKNFSPQLLDSLGHVLELEEIAQRMEIPIHEPTQGLPGFDGQMLILGPSDEYYTEMLAGFDSNPLSRFMNNITKTGAAAVEWIEDRLDIDHLDDENDTTSHSNRSSIVTLFQIDGRKLLFTGDAGKDALISAVNYAAQSGIGMDNLDFLDVPHHGSKRNINTRLINHLRPKIAYVSASKGSDKHPSKRVTNALHKVGTSVHITNGRTISHNYNAPDRGWAVLTPEPFHARFQD